MCPKNSDMVRFDPTLSSNNSGLTYSITKTITVSELAGRQHSYGIPWIPQNCNREKRKRVCIALVHYGPFPQEINEKSVHYALSSLEKCQ